MVRLAPPLLLALLALVIALPAVARAAEPASRYNANGQLHALVCVPLASPTAPLRYTDGSETGFQVTNQYSFNDGRCPPNTVRLDYHEAFPLDMGSLVFHRGGNGYADEQNVKYGQLLTSDLGARRSSATATRRPTRATGPTSTTPTCSGAS